MGAVFLAACGCDSRGVDSEPLEHVHAAHRPATFADAVNELERRGEALFGASQVEDRRGELSELSDIIGWLPELAADSDLGRADWERARGAAERLREVFERLAAESQPAPRDVEEYRAAVEGLKPLARSSEA